ncbi:WYL domain-containing protein [Streptomyces sp. V4-01]|uniref:WYL domain-containing protein n=1 Tax=Actinacidiphila polyblastidii TaxID=3110430 RepID=A0ABU7PKT2_9ACTN|nr:WYL domain-containing protein [Streptomyces sp. V4-01]
MKLTKNQTEQTTLAAMYRAAARRHPVTITYTKADGTETIRTIEIHDIRTTKAGQIILRAADRQAGELRTFRLDRIQAYTIHRTTYTVTLPETDTPARALPAPSSPAALVAYELGRDDRPARRHLTPAA